MSNYLGIAYLVPVDPNARLVPARPFREQQAPLIQKRKPRCKKFEYFEIMEVLAWLVLLVHNFVLYIVSLQKRPLMIAIIMLFVVSLTQPTFYLVSILTKHKFLNTIACAIMMVISLYIGTSEWAHDWYFVLWLKISTYLIAGFSIWGVLKHLIARLKHNHKIFSILSSLFLGILTFSIKLISHHHHHHHLRSPEYVLLALACCSFFMVLIPPCQNCGGKFLRFLLKFLLIVGQIFVVYADSFQHKTELQMLVVFLSRVFSIVHMILTLRCLWKMEENLKKEGEKLYNSRIAHDRFTN